MAKTNQYIGLDIGTVRIGVALADASVGIAVPYGTIRVDGHEFEALARLVVDHDITRVVVGYPRNQSGEPTAQTTLVEQFATQLKSMEQTVIFQDESLTSVMAEARLSSRAKPYAKEDIDAEAASIILQDYLEQQR